VKQLFSRKKERRTYYFPDMIGYMDKVVGKIATNLEKLGLRENTLILFTGDNGTSQNIRSMLGDKPVQGGEGRSTDAGTHVPLIASWPRVIPQGRVGRVPSVVEKEKGVFSRYPKTTTGSWGESDRGGIRLWEKVYKDWGLWKRYSVGIG
jgi:hypothetical protein